MKRLVIEMEENLHKQVKIKAVYEDMSIRDYVKNLIEKDLETKKEQTHAVQS